MCFNQAGVNLIKQFEGFRSTFYNDIVGVKTIGYGSACNSRDCSKIRPPISEATAAKMLKDDIDRSYGKCVRDRVRTKINANQYSALSSLVYNIGCGGFAESTVLRELNAGRIPQAASAFMMWVKAGGVTVQGLVNRRRAEVALFKSKSTSKCI